MFYFSFCQRFEDDFNRINQLDHGGAPLMGPNLGQGGEPVQGPIPNVDGVLREEHNLVHTSFVCICVCVCVWCKTVHCTCMKCNSQLELFRSYLSHGCRVMFAADTKAYLTLFLN